MPIAKVEQYNGEPTIMIDGIPYPPMTITVPIRDGEYLKKLGEAGLKIYYVVSSTSWHDPGDKDKGEPNGLEKTMASLDVLLSSVPDAYVILRLNVSPPPDWVNAHPDEQVTYSDGSHERVICTSVSRKPIDGMHLLCSEEWRRDGDAALKEYFGELERSRHFNRIIGFFLCAGGTSEWYYPNALRKDDGAYGDFSEPFRKEYESYLRSKYKTVDELRKAWKRPDASFEHPIIPDANDKFFIYDADKRITDALRNWEVEGRAIGMKLDIDAKLESSVGVFLNANNFMYVADFYAAWNLGTANTIVHFANTLKERYPDLLVGAFYGALGCANYFDASTSSGTLTILDSGVVNFLAAPGTYNNREPGGVVAQREMQDSFRIRNQIYICEDDSRTHRTKPWIQKEAMALYSVEDSITTLKRDFARDLCEEVNGWWFDMGGDWYDDPKILDLFKRQREITDFAFGVDRTKKNDIALIYDTESLHYISQSASQMILDFYRTSDLSRIGAPVDYYFHNDMANPDMRDYKLYLFINQFYLTNKELDAIYNKARRNGATIIWLYAPGFVNPDSDTVMTVQNIEKTVGMHTGIIDKTIFPYFRVNPEVSPALKLAGATRLYGYIDRNVHSNIWIGSTVLPPIYANPGFYIDDPSATILGSYCADGKTALAMKEMDGFTSVYCATQVIRSDLIASLAEWSGCHLFTYSDDVIYANENFVAIHAKDDGKRAIFFKEPCSPYEVYEKNYYGHNVKKIDIDMKLGETKMWSLKGAF